MTRYAHNKTRGASLSFYCAFICESHRVCIHAGGKRQRVSQGCQKVWAGAISPKKAVIVWLQPLGATSSQSRSLKNSLAHSRAVCFGFKLEPEPSQAKPKPR